MIIPLIFGIFIFPKHHDSPVVIYPI